MNALILGLLLPALIPAWVQQSDTLRTVWLDSVAVIAVGALPGTTLNRQSVPFRVQTARAGAIQTTQATDLTDLMNRTFGSVHLTTPGGNPLQPALHIRGFQASPLLGSPQGISVYQDGVRLNDLFGDLVNWDLLPQSAVAGITLGSGSQPLFGLNALGGALALTMKSGFSDAGLRVSVYGGSFGRVNAEVSAGRSRGRQAWFVAAQQFGETGWRDHSPTHATLGYGRWSRHGPRTDLDLSLTVGRSRLVGNGTLPEAVRREQPRAVFTYPDQTTNQHGLVTATLAHRPNERTRLTLLTYGRLRPTHTLNGDASTYATSADGYLTPGEEDERDKAVVNDQYGQPVRATEAVMSGVNNRSQTRQWAGGLSGQLARQGRLFGRESQWLAGVSFDGGTARFSSETELARLTDERSTVGSGLTDADSRVAVATRVTHSSAFGQLVALPAPDLTVTLSGRITGSGIMLTDEIGTALNGNHTFLLASPSAGMVYALSQQLSVYGSYALSGRTPTPVELTCADPSAPCRLPNSFLSDPPLRPVKARTWEGGWRGQFRNWTWTWSANVFRNDLRNDLLFVSAGPGRNSGYFTNVGSTRRQGLELSVEKRRGWWHGQIQYTYQRATFRDELTLNSPHHPGNSEGEIMVRPGNELPLIPKHLLKGNGEVVFGHQRGLIGVDYVLTGAQFARGDENNSLTPLAAYGLVTLRAQGRLTKHWMLTARLTNVHNARYDAFGLLGPAQALPGLPPTGATRWVTPGPPRQGQLGLVWQL